MRKIIPFFAIAFLIVMNGANARCMDGATGSCSVGGKNGTRECYGGYWGPCHVHEPEPPEPTAQPVINVSANQNGQEMGDQSSCCSGPLIDPITINVAAGTYAIIDAWGQPGASFGAWNYNRSQSNAWVWHWKVFALDGHGGYRLLQDVAPNEAFATETEAMAFGRCREVEV